MKRSLLIVCVILLVVSVPFAISGIAALFKAAVKPPGPSLSTVAPEDMPPSSYQVANSNLTIAAEVAPLETLASTSPEAASWESVKLSRIGVSVNLKFDENEPCWYSSYVGDSISRLLASLGIMVVNGQPSDAEMTVTVTGRTEWQNYVSQATYYFSTKGDGTSYPTAAYVEVRVDLTAPQHQTLSVTNHYEEMSPDEIPANFGFADTPMNKATAPGLIADFIQLWGNKVITVTLSDQNQSPFMRFGAAYAPNFGIKISPSENDVIFALVHASFNDPSDLVRSEAQSDLVVLGPKASSAMPALIQMLQTRDPDVRSSLAQILGAIGPDANASIPTLQIWTQDNNDIVRFAAVTALGLIQGGPGIVQDHFSAVPYLLEAVHDKNETVSQAAVHSLGEILYYYYLTPGHLTSDAKQVIPVLIDLMKSATDSHNSDMVNECGGSLSWITGQTGITDVSGWETWWSQQK